MNKLILSFAFFGILLSSCSRNRIDPSADVTSQTKSFTNFSKIDVSNAISVYVTFSETEESVIVVANDNLHEYIKIEKEGNELEIRLKRNINISGMATLKVYITTSYLSSIEASGASNVHFSNTYSSTNLNVDLSGASSFNADLILDHLVVEGSGASNINLSGECSYLNSELSGASSIEDYGFYVNEEVRTDLSGASSSKLTINGDIYVEASGASSFYYKGIANIKSQKISGASSIKQK